MGDLPKKFLINLKDVRSQGEGVRPMRTLMLNFACKRPKFEYVGEGINGQNFVYVLYGCQLWDACFKKQRGEASTSKLRACEPPRLWLDHRPLLKLTSNKELMYKSPNYDFLNIFLVFSKICSFLLYFNFQKIYAFQYIFVFFKNIRVDAPQNDTPHKLQVSI